MINPMTICRSLWLPNVNAEIVARIKFPFAFDLGRANDNEISECELVLSVQIECFAGDDLPRR